MSGKTTTRTRNAAERGEAKTVVGVRAVRPPRIREPETPVITPAAKHPFLSKIWPFGKKKEKPESVDGPKRPLRNAIVGIAVVGAFAVLVPLVGMLRDSRVDGIAPVQTPAAVEQTQAPADMTPVDILGAAALNKLLYGDRAQIITETGEAAISADGTKMDFIGYSVESTSLKGVLAREGGKLNPILAENTEGVWLVPIGGKTVYKIGEKVVGFDFSASLKQAGHEQFPEVCVHDSTGNIVALVVPGASEKPSYAFFLNIVTGIVEHLDLRPIEEAEGVRLTKPACVYWQGDLVITSDGFRGLHTVTKREEGKYTLDGIKLGDAAQEPLKKPALAVDATDRLVLNADNLDKAPVLGWDYQIAEFVGLGGRK